MKLPKVEESILTVTKVIDKGKLKPRLRRDCHILLGLLLAEQAMLEKRSITMSATMRKEAQA